MAKVDVGHSVAALLVCAAVLGGCRGDNPVAPRPPHPSTAAVASVTITPQRDTAVSLGEDLSFSATAKDASGSVLSGVAFTWTSTDTAVASLSSSGQATSRANGTTRIIAAAGGHSDTATLVVAQVTASVEVTPDTAILSAVGDTLRFAAAAKDATGHLVAGATIAWASSDPSVATIDSSGLATALRTGQATVAASAGDGKIVGRALLTVGSGVPSGIQVGPNVDMGTGSEGSITINPTDPINLVASANSFQYYSLDGGSTWQQMSVPTYTWPAASAPVDPNVAFNSQGVLYHQGLGWPHSGDPTRAIGVMRSTDKGQSLPANLTAWAYAPADSEGNPDQGIMAIDDQRGSPYEDRVYVIASDYPLRQPIYQKTGFALIVMHSADGGRTFSAPVDISESLNGAQEANSYIATGPDGQVYAAWYNAAGQVMFDRSLDGGDTWGPDIVVANVPPATGACPISDDVRGNITLAVDRGSGPYRGRIYVSSIFWNGKGCGSADAWMAYSTDGGSSWSSPLLLSDGPTGPYHYYFQPRISVAPNGRVDAVWYDTRLGTTTDVNDVFYDLYYTNSTDGGVSVGPNVRVTSTTSEKVTNCPTQRACGDRMLFEYIGLASDDDRAIPVWTDLRLGYQHLFSAVISIQP